MMSMDAFEELGITASAQTPNPRTTARNLGEVLTAVAAGTALTAAGIFALIAIAVAVLVFH
jgi:hypothetical protein